MSVRNYVDSEIPEDIQAYATPSSQHEKKNLRMKVCEYLRTKNSAITVLWFTSAACQ